MRSSFFFYTRLAFAWAFLLIFALAFTSNVFHRGQGWIFLSWVVVMFFVFASAAAHIRHVRRINGTANAGTLANRQRRQIEVPMPTVEAFDVLEATIRELPHVEQVESLRDKLQVYAKVKRIYPYGARIPLLQRMLGWFDAKRNQIFATITPHSDTSTVRHSAHAIPSMISTGREAPMSSAAGRKAPARAAAGWPVHPS